ncbi:hypothetical protein GIB67_004967 [Kingdonia uniflora]|uniref:Uncharacterized protein n=1 Tax=Kingdonia uniflora TaxID=39325 RepID=A0A7J7NMK6_9MAGN|nr:hypothetical protein GIB67_004967 [Kingdonia uniflora]
MYDECDTDDGRKKNCPKKTKPEDWVRFVDLTSTEEVKGSRERNKINKSKMLTPYTTGRNEVFRVADEMMEVDPTITRSYSILVGHTRSDGTFPTTFLEKKVRINVIKTITVTVVAKIAAVRVTKDHLHFWIVVKDIIAKNPQSKFLDDDHDPLAQVFGPVKKGCVNFMGPDITKKFIQSTELLRAHTTEDKKSYIYLENRFSQYKAENDVRFENLKDMVAPLRSSGCATISTEISWVLINY